MTFGQNCVLGEESHQKHQLKRIWIVNQLTMEYYFGKESVLSTLCIFNSESPNFKI